MTEISIPETQEIQTQPKIAVIGVGGAGGNAVDNMIASEIEGVNFLVANTDAQALQKSKASERVQLGATTTKGLGAGSKPDVGKASALEAADTIKEKLKGLDMLFIAAGMGGGTGTGASPVIAQIAKEMDILTVAVVTKPFSFEGRPKMRRAEDGINELSQCVDTLLVIPNQNLLQLATAQNNLSANEAFKIVDSVLSSGIKSITDLMVTPGLINLDFADIKTGMLKAGRAMMGTGEAAEGKNGDTTAITAAKEALSNPLLDNTDIKDAKTVIVNVTCGPNLSLVELDEAVNFISDSANSETNFMHGIRFDNEMDNSVRISIVATGISDSGNTITVSEPVKTKKITPHSTEKTTDAFSLHNEDEVITLSEPKTETVPEKAEEKRSTTIETMPDARNYFASITTTPPEQQTMPFMTPEVIPLKNNEKIFKSHESAEYKTSEKDINKEENKSSGQSFTLEQQHNSADNITVDPQDKPSEIPSFFENIPFFRK